MAPPLIDALMFPALLDAIFDIASGVIAVIVSYEAARARSFSKEDIFLSFEVSFALLAGSNVLRGLLVLLELLTRRPFDLVRPFNIVGDLIQAFVAAVAYAILLWVQIKSVWPESNVVSQIGPVGLGMVILPINILNVFMLLALAALVFVRLTKDRNLNQALVTIGFLFLACAHLSNVLGYGTPFLLAIENLLRLAGYLSLLAMLVRLRKTA
ncbi:MAG TPA: hypothetical protein VEG31_03415 [Thermoproteota archaeon]|nr:hypothetical protein [Thermoproteota archaeon]